MCRAGRCSVGLTISPENIRSRLPSRSCARARRSSSLQRAVVDPVLRIIEQEIAEFDMIALEPTRIGREQIVQRACRRSCPCRRGPPRISGRRHLASSESPSRFRSLIDIAPAARDRETEGEGKSAGSAPTAAGLTHDGPVFSRDQEAHRAAAFRGTGLGRRDLPASCDGRAHPSLQVRADRAQRSAPPASSLPPKQPRHCFDLAPAEQQPFITEIRHESPRLARHDRHPLRHRSRSRRSRTSATPSSK